MKKIGTIAISVMDRAAMDVDVVQAVTGCMILILFLASLN